MSEGGWRQQVHGGRNPVRVLGQLREDGEGVARTTCNDIVKNTALTLSSQCYPPPGLPAAVRQLTTPTALHRPAPSLTARGLPESPCMQVLSNIDISGHSLDISIFIDY